MKCAAKQLSWAAEQVVTCHRAEYMWSCLALDLNLWLEGYLGLFNPLLLNPAKTSLSQWFLNLLSNQANAAKLAAFTWFDRRFKNH